MKRALITEIFHPILVENLTKMDYQCDVVEDIDTQGVIDIISKYEILIINSKITVDEALLNQASQLKIIGRVGSGLDIVDLDACEQRNIIVLSSPEGNARAVAEHTLGFLLSSINHQAISQREILEGKWIREDRRGHEISGKTIAIIGLGHVGYQLAKLLGGFDMEVLAYDHAITTCDIEYVKLTTMDEIYRRAQIVSIHLPLTETTRGMIEGHFFNQFEHNIYFINTARGAIVDINAVLDGLKHKKIIQAMLDVFPNEPFIPNQEIKKWCEEGKLFHTPHIAGWTHESKYKLAQILVNKVRNALNT